MRYSGDGIGKKSYSLEYRESYMFFNLTADRICQGNNVGHKMVRDTGENFRNRYGRRALLNTEFQRAALIAIAVVVMAVGISALYMACAVRDQTCLFVKVKQVETAICIVVMKLQNRTEYEYGYYERRYVRLKSLHTNTKVL